MKFLILSLTILTCMATPSFAASVEMPVNVKIFNLAQMPVEEAIAFCNERNLACPAIREKHEKESRAELDISRNRE